MLLTETELEELSNSVQIAGLIRFSFPSLNRFRKRYDTIEEKVEALYAAERMEERFALFEAICLHSLKRQTNKNFTIGLLVGSNMPPAYRERLDRLLVDFPQAQVIALPPMRYGRAIKRAFKQLFDAGTDYRISFRLDDDDAVAMDFIEEVQKMLPTMFSLSGGIEPVALSFNRTLTLAGAASDRKLFAGTVQLPLGIGLCVLAPRKWKKHVFSFGHTRIVREMKTIFVPEPYMCLRSCHNSNDSHCRFFGWKGSEDQAEIGKILAERFDMDIIELKAL